MNPLTMRIAETPITEWRGVLVRVKVDLPNAPHSFSYQQVYDHKLTPFRAIHRPSDTASEMELREYSQQLSERQRYIETIAMQIASSLFHAISRVDNA